MAKLEIKNLNKSFNSVSVLEDINLSVNEGEFIVLVGPSGSGKSTILRIIAGLESISSGEIILNNKVINKLHPKERNIAMVFQNYALYPHMTVEENLAFPLKMLKVDKKEIKNAVENTSELLGIKRYLSKRPKELSGGERQRVALGRAIIRKPKIFLMDEPLSNLDAKLRTQMRAELLKLHRELKATIIYVTHDQIEALTMGNRIAVLNHGKLQQFDVPFNVYNNPENIFVAGFIGSPGINIFNFKVIDRNTIEIAGQKISCNLPEHQINVLNQYSLINKEIFLGVRPEDCTFSSSDYASLDAVIEFIEMHGNEYLIYLRVASGSNVKFAMKINSAKDLSVNQSLKVKIDIDKVKYFSKETGKLIKI